MKDVMRVALYARVSTHDQQTLPLQLEALREYAHRRNWQIEREVSEVASSAAAIKFPSGRRSSKPPSVERWTPSSSGGWAMAAMVAVFAQFEREILKERIKARIAQAKAQGKAMGRPRTVAKQVEEMHNLQALGVSLAGIARKLGLGWTLVRRLLNSQNFNSHDLTLKKLRLSPSLARTRSPKPSARPDEPECRLSHGGAILRPVVAMLALPPLGLL